MSEGAKTAWTTRRQKERGRRVASHRNQLMLGVKDLLNEWNERARGEERCVVCGDNVPKTILQRHHLNPFNKSEGKIWLCASCHNIFNKAKETTTIDDVVQDLNLRHRRLN